MNRGSKQVAAKSTSWRRAFNEAPIHESGKYVFQIHARHGIKALQ